MLFDTKSTLTAHASLDALWLRTQVITNNLANVDTPGFKASDVSFETALSNARRVQNTEGRAVGEGDGAAAHRAGVVQNTEGRRVSEGGTAASSPYRARVATDDTTAVRQDGNNVSLEREQTELWKSYAQYSYLLDSMSNHYKAIGSAISGMRV